MIKAYQGASRTRWRILARSKPAHRAIAVCPGSSPRAALARRCRRLHPVRSQMMRLLRHSSSTRRPCSSSSPTMFPPSKRTAGAVCGVSRKLAKTSVSACRSPCSNARSDKKNGQLCAIVFLSEIKPDEHSLRFYYLDEKAVQRIEHHGTKNRPISPNHSFCEPPSANLKRRLESHHFAATSEA